MHFVSPIARGLAFLGRHGTKTFAASIFLGLALPWLAEALRPLLPVTIVMFVAMAFARADLAAIRQGLRRPGRLGLALLWSTLTMPVLLWVGVWLVGRENIDPGLLLGLALIAGAPPLMASPVYAALLGFQTAAPLTLLVAGMAMTPLIGPPLASLIAGAAVPIDPLVLSARLASLLAIAIFIAMALRRFVGVARLASLKSEIDGLNVFLFFIFAVAAMDGVIRLTLADPWRTALFTTIAFLVCGLGFGLTLVAMRWLGRAEAFTLALGVGLRNTGLLVAPLGAAIPDTAYLFFSLLQFPIYMAPLLVEPLARLAVGKTAPALREEDGDDTGSA